MLALNAAKRLQLSSVARCILTQTRAEHSAAPIGNGASATSPARPLDRIYLQGMQFFGHHGVLPEETRDGQDFFVDATLLLDLRPAGKSDDLTRTVNYAEVFRDIADIVQGEPRQLIESVAAAAADIILRRHPLVQTAIVRVDKPHAPIDGDFGTVAVEVTRSREHIG